MNSASYFSARDLLQALKVALLVGSALTLINQFDALVGQADFKWLAALLTYCVPFTVFVAGRSTADSGVNKANTERTEK